MRGVEGTVSGRGLHDPIGGPSWHTCACGEMFQRFGSHDWVRMCPTCQGKTQARALLERERIKAPQAARDSDPKD